jgi:kumamolisin
MKRLIEKLIFGLLLLSPSLICAWPRSVSAAEESKNAPERKVFKNSITEIPPHMSLHVESATDEHANDPMQLLFSIELPKNLQDELDQRVKSGKILSTQEMQKYRVPDATYAKLKKWLDEQELQIIRTNRPHTHIYVKGTVAQIEKALDVKMVRVKHEGMTYNATENPPSMPADVGAEVHGIIGLQPYLQAIKHIVKYNPPQIIQPAPVAVALSTPPSPTPAARPSGYLVSEIMHAYNADSTPFTGDGEKIAILIDKFPTDQDLKEFWKISKLPNTIDQIEKIDVNGGVTAPPDGEESMDVEISGGIASKATVRIYAAGSLFLTDLDAAVDRLIDDLDTEPNIHQLSISMGLGEMGMSTAEFNVEHLQMQRLVGRGVNVFVSSGDDGSRPRGSSGHLPQVEYQSSDPLAIAVGGTRLILKPDGTRKSERAWEGSGGGQSEQWARETFQIGSGISTGTWRLVPDVCAVAAPDTGAFVYVSGTEQTIGGTSLSAPIWAGFCAMINEGRTKAGKGPLPQLHPLLYPLNGKPEFHDITAGTNGDFSAAAGYDMVTGLGAPDVKQLISTLSK